ncbi:class II aldolase/adducin family protein [Roseomonas fluvialis]|uniref:Fuculose phosphate aldolase n=1 Tax=Roseomonas fluvialis TaxID=1750527 RepID=A0ABN6P7R4_9PROT|nr:class II aldolase/adducin family protein [Roseomonas fluvialis]BDG73797.1 fuculose phosphate aldolase [Roseomonas fluvialis]
MNAGALLAAARRLDAAGFMPSKSGNLSMRDGDGFLITPAALPYADTAEADLVRMTADGSATGRRRPSSEWQLHAAVYAARPDANAVVHTHSPRATALSCARSGIPPFHYMVLLAGGDVRCAAHATFGTVALANNAVAALEGRRAVLLANHGAVAMGATLAAALTLAFEIENLAGQYLDLLAAGLEPVLLDARDLAEAAAQFAGYGRG